MEIAIESSSLFANFDENENPIKRARMDPDHYRPPSAEELYNLKNSENLYQSNLFRLQLNELVTEITMSDAEIKAADLLINDLSKIMKKMKPIKNLKFSDMKEFEDANLSVPLGNLGKKLMKEGTYSFEPPTDVFIIGSHATSTHLKKSRLYSIDLALEIDASFFNERDYLNYRYFLKKNLYISHVYLQLAATKRFSKIKYEFMADYSSLYKTTLCLIFEDESLEINLHVIPNSGAFKLNRFNPNQSNVRREFFGKFVDSNFSFDQTAIQNGNNNEYESENDVPTPSYNFDILSDLTMKANTEFLKEKLGNSKGLLEAIKLLKVWLIKRDLNEGTGCFDSFTLNMFIAYLLLNKHINPFMSSYQIFRITLLTLSEANWHKTGISVKNCIKSIDINDSKQIPISDFHKRYQVVLIDSTGYLNLASKMAKQTFLRVKHEANLGISMLNNESVDNFNQLFISNQDSQLVFDTLLSINPYSNCLFYRDILKKLPVEQNKLMDSYNNGYPAAANMITNLINKALEERVDLVFTHSIPKQRWTVKSMPKDTLPPILIGILFNEKFDNVLIKGPSSTSPEAVEFRNFWGKKSELRRFQDTSICEAVYFESNTVAAKRLIYSEIVHYILNLHLSIEQDHICFSDRQMNSLLSLPTGTIKNYGTGEERLANVTTTFDEFSRLIKNLKDLPLSISQINGISSAFRLTDVFAPLPSCFKYDAMSEKNMRIKLENKYVPKYPPGPVMVPFVKPIEAFIQLESSGKWPDDLECIRRLKTAFYIAIVKGLRETYNLTAFTNIDYFDVVYKGFVFRLSVYTMNELLCIKNEVNDLGIIVTKESKESIEYEKVFFSIPKLNNVLHGLQQKYTCFSGVCRLAKRWLASQFLLEYFEEEAIDLICSSLFVHPNAHEAPKSLITGFTRFLDLMANFDWKNQLLQINFNNEFKKGEILSIQVQFQENRSNLPAVFISTPYDGSHKNSVWTLDKPNIQQLCRTVLIAKQSLAKIKASIINFESNESFKNLFRPSLQMFDVVIHLKPSYCVKAHQQIDICEGTFLPHYRDFDPTDTKDKTFPVVDFDPVRSYVKELRETYEEIALFFYDVYGCTKIFVLWKPDALKPKEMKIANVKYRLIDTTKNQLELNVEAVLDDFKLIGSELVENVLIKTESNFFK